MADTFGNYSSYIQKYTNLLANGFGIASPTTTTTQATQPASTTSIYDVNQLMQIRTSQRQELAKELSDTQLAIKLNQDAQLVLDKQEQEAAADPDKVLEYHQQSVAMEAELKRLEMQQQALSQEYTAISSQSNPYQQSPREIAIEVELYNNNKQRLTLAHSAQEAVGNPELLAQLHEQDLALEQKKTALEAEKQALSGGTSSTAVSPASIQAELNSLQSQRIELVQKAQDAVGNPELLMQIHQEDLALEQKKIALEEKQNAFNTTNYSNTGNYFNTGGYNTGTYGTTTPNYSSGTGLFDSYINRYTSMLRGGFGIMPSTTGSYGQNSSSSMMMQQQMMQQQAMMQQQQAAKQQMMMQMMMGMLGGSSDSGSSSSTNPMSQMMSMFSGMMGGSSSASTNPMSSMMSMFSGMMGGSSSAPTSSSSSTNTLTQLMQKYLG
ncbi:MAG: hypothetical protein A2Y25_01045 [Candidatus Melainabacteria bacterium GWF2_37_15]|nr:MAG: hypothetical protein A2Y25_01045 [Candidatus Melainabacteria bacterium GWF2_37_15]